MSGPLPQEFPRELALLELDDVLPGLASEAREAFTAAFEARRADPLNPRGVVLVGEGGLRPLMALMRLVVLRLRDLNLDRFPSRGGEGRYLTAYVKGENLRAPVSDRASALFVERADFVATESALSFEGPLFATWEGPLAGPVWETVRSRCEVISLD